MAAIVTKLAGQVIYFDELKTIELVSYDNSPVSVSLACDGGVVLFDEIYHPGFDGKIFLDIKDIIETEMYLTIPSEWIDTQQTSIYKEFSLTVDDADPIIFTICGYASEALNRITDIDYLRIPKNYKLPLTLINQWDRSGIRFRFPDGTVKETYGLSTSSSIGAVSTMFTVEDSLASGHDSFVVELDCEEKTLYSPVFQICEGDFEQYLFANRYGGFDNIAMDGVREFVPKMSFESGIYSSGNEQISSDSEYIYSQNSGFISKRVAELASELLCSNQIYHLDKDGEFRRIVILDSNIETRSDESLQSFSFKYKYVEDSRPAMLKMRGVTSYAGTSASERRTQVHAVNTSPQIVTHNLGRFPNVTVINKEREVVMTGIEYQDDNHVTISWIGELEGYIYIN